MLYIEFCLIEALLRLDYSSHRAKNISSFICRYYTNTNAVPLKKGLMRHTMTYRSVKLMCTR